MTDTKTYTGIIMIPRVIRTDAHDLVEAERIFKHHIHIHLSGDIYTLLNDKGEPVMFEPRLQFIQEGDLRDEQVDTIA